VRVLVAVAAIGATAGLFVAGRASFDRGHGSSSERYVAGYRAGQDAVFAGYDGGWSYGEPYVVILRRGRPGVTHRIARRVPMRAGIDYRLCARVVCERRTGG
jgi:hypothetical protein